MNRKRSWWHHSKEKQNNVKSWFSLKIRIFILSQNAKKCSSNPRVFEQKFSTITFHFNRYYYRKTELGTKATRSQLCINLVLRYYANKFNFSAMITLNASFISSGKKERSINSNHFSFALANLAKMLFITFSSNPDACIEVTKSAFLILRFLPLRASANS